MSELRPFYLAVSGRDIAESRDFYGGLMGFSKGRSAEGNVDFVIEPYTRFKGQAGE